MGILDDFRITVDPNVPEGTAYHFQGRIVMNPSDVVKLKMSPKPKPIDPELEKMLWALALDDRPEEYALILADWLEELGDKRGHRIRLCTQGEPAEEIIRSTVSLFPEAVRPYSRTETNYIPGIKCPNPSCNGRLYVTNGSFVNCTGKPPEVDTPEQEKAWDEIRRKARLWASLFLERSPLIGDPEFRPEWRTNHSDGANYSSMTASLEQFRERMRGRWWERDPDD